MPEFPSILSIRLKKLSKVRTKIGEKLQISSILRLTFFVSSAGFGILGYIYPSLKLYLYIISSISILLFLYTVKVYHSWEFLQTRIDSLASFLKREKKRSEHQLEFLHKGDMAAENPNSFWKDLDVFGKKSLHTYLDTTITLRGSEKLKSLLLQNEILRVEEIQDRQKLIGSLSSAKFRLLKILRLFYQASESEGYTKISPARHFISPSHYYEKHNIIGWIFRPFVILQFIIAGVVFMMDISRIPFSFLILNSIFMAIGFRERNHLLKNWKKFSETFARMKNLAFYLNKIGLLKSPELRDIFKKTEAYERRLQYLDAPLFRMLLNVIFLWEFWEIKSLEKFYSKYKSSVLEMTEKIEDLDSILVFANFHLHNSDAVFPEISENSELEAKKLSHPLIPFEKRVSNALDYMKGGELVLITGSNMSGKTTYIRSIGLNVLLAMCGSPVLAEKMKLPVMKILSSIKNEDSLSEGISFFYSEVKKLRYILETVSDKENKYLILIDEVLKGTNTRERLIASSMILQKLIKSGAFSFVTTHDLDLAKKKNSKIRLRHFREDVDQDGKMIFGYKIQKGLVSSTNALRVLKSEVPDLFK